MYVLRMRLGEGSKRERDKDVVDDDQVIFIVDHTRKLMHMDGLCYN